MKTLEDVAREAGTTPQIINGLIRRDVITPTDGGGKGAGRTHLFSDAKAALVVRYFRLKDQLESLKADLQRPG